MFMRQPRSPAISMPAPLAATLAAFLATIAFEMSGYLTQKVPPKPQHTSGSRISVSVSPRTVPSSRRGWTRTPSSRNPEQVDQERDELMGLGGERIGAREPVGVAVKQLAIMRFQHAGAGARGRHDVIIGREGLDHLFGDGARAAAVAGIEGRLSAAGLGRHRDPAAGILQELDGREADRRPDQIDQAGDEKTDALGRIGHWGSFSAKQAGRLAESGGCRKRAPRRIAAMRRA